MMAVASLLSPLIWSLCSATYGGLPEGDPAALAELGGGFNYWVFFLKTIFVLGIVCLIAYLSLRLVFFRIIRAQGRDDGIFKIVDRFALEPKKALYIVEVAGKFFLLGVSEQQVNYLAELDEKLVRDALEASGERGSARFLRSFDVLLTNKLSLYFKGDRADQDPSSIKAKE